MGDETARLRARVEQLEEELAAARVQMARDASHRALCKGAMEKARSDAALVERQSNSLRRLRQEIAKLKQANEPQP